MTHLYRLQLTYDVYKGVASVDGSRGTMLDGTCSRTIIILVRSTYATEKSDTWRYT